MTLPNFLTIFRIFISPIFLAVYAWHASLGISASLLPYILLSLLFISELSDGLDGFLARKYNQVTDFGKLIDPMADSIYRVSVFLTFTLPPISLPLILVFAFLYRDSVIGTLRTICALRGFALAARPSGKLKAVLQAVVSISIVLLMIPASIGTLSYEALRAFAFWLTLVAALYAFLSAFDYLIANRKFIVRALITKDGRRLVPSRRPLRQRNPTSLAGSHSQD